jgi:hypothetical protein
MIQDIYDATIDSVLEGFDDCEHSLVRNAYQKYLQDYYGGFTVVTPDNSRYELLVGFHIKAGIDLDMSGYSCWPPEFEKGASIIVKEYNELLKKTGEALEKMESTEISILRMKTGETCELMGPVFKIGRAVKGSSPTQDYSITDNSAISRSHAEIIMRNGHYYIVDQDSNNKTFVDGVSIVPNTEVEISLESCIRLADEEFRFTSSKRQLFAKRLK